MDGSRRSRNTRRAHADYYWSVIPNDRTPRAPAGSVALATLCLFSFFANHLLLAGTIRDDRDPQLYLDYAKDPKFASAGSLKINRDAPGFFGSGVLVADRWVLTAGHLLEGTTQITFSVGGTD